MATAQAAPEVVPAEAPNVEPKLASNGDTSAQESVQMLIYGYVSASLTTNLMHLGDKLGLYKTMASSGPSSAEDLARKLNLSPRYVYEWCLQQSSAKVISCDDVAKKFWLSEPQKDVLVREYGPDASPFFSLGFVQGLPTLANIASEKLPELFKTGKGIDYDAYGDALACGTCRELGVWLRHCLVDRLRSMPGIAEKLESGCKVADVGCGCGVAVITAAAAFPNSTFHGFDISEVALAHARQMAKEQGLKESQVEFKNPGVDESGMGDGGYDIVMTHDAIHDMTAPYDVMKSVRKAIAPGGVWIIGDMNAGPNHGINVSANPMSPLLYGFSCHLCLPSAMSAPNAAGLGTLGLSANLAKEKLLEAGFKDVSILDWGHPLNRYYLATT